MATLATEEFYIIEPAEATNEVTNPSFETGTTGYTLHGAGVAIARSTTYQRRGLYSLAITPANGVESGAYFATVNETVGTARTFSADVKGVAGQAMRIQIRTTAGVLLSETTFTANGYWQRVKVTRTGDAATTRRLYIVRDAVASVAVFYIDGLYYSTVDGTYLDGDMKGFTRATDYRWNGTAHASTSWRSGQTRSGGTLLRIRDFARILLTLGLGMAPITNAAQPLTLDYSSYQTTKVNSREFVFALAFTGLTPGAIQANRQEIIDAVKPDRVAIRQPLVIRYQGLDSSGGDASETVDLIAHYVDGLDNQPGQPGIEKANVRFVSYLPFIQSDGESAAVLGYQTTVANFANIGYRDTDGTWKAMGTGADSFVNALAVGPDGSVYAGGNFAAMSGVANTVGIAKWDGAAWTPLGTGAGGVAPYVNSLAFGPDGSLYAGGAFSSMGGVANTAYIAKWDGAAWNALGTGANGVVNEVAFGPDGSLYAGGAFTLMGGVANTIRIAKWNGAAWSALGTGAADDRIYTIVLDANGNLYAGGGYSGMGGVANTASIAKWDGAAWSSISSGISGGASRVTALAFDAAGVLYVGGDFTSIGGISAAYVASWNGTSWEALTGRLNDKVLYMAPGPDGYMYLSGEFTTANGINLPDSAVKWMNGAWTPLDINVQDAAAIFYAFTFDTAGRFYLGGFWAGTDALSATVTAPALGGARAYPKVKFTGPGTVYQLKNYTNNKAIYFKNLTLVAGEVATLDLTPGHVSFTSSFRGSLFPYILNGSSLDWYLQSGTNNVSAYMTGTTAASGIVMIWRDLYWSIDGAKR